LADKIARRAGLRDFVNDLTETKTPVRVHPAYMRKASIEPVLFRCVHETIGVPQAFAAADKERPNAH
jgi:hypothetical protein